MIDLTCQLFTLTIFGQLENPHVVVVAHHLSQCVLNGWVVQVDVKVRDLGWLTELLAAFTLNVLPVVFARVRLVREVVWHAAVLVWGWLVRLEAIEEALCDGLVGCPRRLRVNVGTTQTSHCKRQAIRFDSQESVTLFHCAQTHVAKHSSVLTSVDRHLHVGTA